MSAFHLRVDRRRCFHKEMSRCILVGFWQPQRAYCWFPGGSSSLDNFAGSVSAVGSSLSHQIEACSTPKSFMISFFSSQPKLHKITCISSQNGATLLRRKKIDSPWPTGTPGASPTDGSQTQISAVNGCCHPVRLEGGNLDAKASFVVSRGWRK